jgi:hypothetical protein
MRAGCVGDGLAPITELCAIDFPHKGHARDAGDGDPSDGEPVRRHGRTPSAIISIPMKMISAIV